MKNQCPKLDLSLNAKLSLISHSKPSPYFLDVERDEPDDRRCMRELRKLSNSIRSDIQMEEDVPSNYEDGKPPILDFKIWNTKYKDENGEERNRLVTEFYEKPMVGTRMLMEKSALSRKIKISSVTNGTEEMYKPSRWGTQRIKKQTLNKTYV